MCCTLDPLIKILYTPFTLWYLNNLILGSPLTFPLPQQYYPEPHILVCNSMHARSENFTLEKWALHLVVVARTLLCWRLLSKKQPMGFFFPPPTKTLPPVI